MIHVHMQFDVVFRNTGDGLTWPRVPGVIDRAQIVNALLIR